MLTPKKPETPQMRENNEATIQMFVDPKNIVATRAPMTVAEILACLTEIRDNRPNWIESVLGL